MNRKNPKRRHKWHHLRRRGHRRSGESTRVDSGESKGRKRQGRKGRRSQSRVRVEPGTLGRWTGDGTEELELDVMESERHHNARREDDGEASDGIQSEPGTEGNSSHPEARRSRRVSSHDIGNERIAQSPTRAYEMSGGLAEPQQGDRLQVPTGERPLLPPNQRRRESIGSEGHERRPRSLTRDFERSDLAEPQQEDRLQVPIGRRSALSPNQQRRVRTQDSAGRTIRSGESSSERADRHTRVRGVPTSGSELGPWGYFFLGWRRPERVPAGEHAGDL